jgi:hypothetical protein
MACKIVDKYTDVKAGDNIIFNDGSERLKLKLLFFDKSQNAWVARKGRIVTDVYKSDFAKGHIKKCSKK